MAFNSFGNIFKLTSFGESHGTAIGGIIEGCPAGLEIDFAFVQEELNKRKPGQSHIVTQRKENDEVEFLSGIFEGKTTGLPIGFTIKNTNAKSNDYSHLKDAYRPSHADYTYQEKYGHRDYRGGGRSSARETACRVVAGAIAKLFLAHYKIKINAFVKQVGEIKLEKKISELNLEDTFLNIVRCPDKEIAEQMINHIESIKKQGDTIGGIIQCVIQNCPVGLGEPVFDKLNAVLAHAMLSINAVKGFEIGAGFDAVSKKGSELNDEFIKDADGKLLTKTNYSGGIQGGISNGMPIYFNVAFKPVATIMQPQNTLNKLGEEIVLEARGRHDPCVLPRAVPIVEAMAAMVIADFLLVTKVNKL